MRNLIVIVGLVISLISCDSNRVFDEYQPMESGTWLKDNVVSFEFAMQDTVSKKNLFINVRNNNDYEFSNLFLIAKIKFPDGYKVVDTLEYEMTDKIGNFLGTGYTDIKENKLFYKQGVRFTKEGTYTVNIEQAMRKSNQTIGIDSLKGITDVGLRIENIKN